MCKLHLAYAFAFFPSFQVLDPSLKQTYRSINYILKYKTFTQYPGETIKKYGNWNWEKKESLNLGKGKSFSIALIACSNFKGYK